MVARIVQAGFRACYYQNLFLGILGILLVYAGPEDEIGPVLAVLMYSIAAGGVGWSCGFSMHHGIVSSYDVFEQHPNILKP